MGFVKMIEDANLRRYFICMLVSREQGVGMILTLMLICKSFATLIGNDSVLFQNLLQKMFYGIRLKDHCLFDVGVKEYYSLKVLWGVYLGQLTIYNFARHHSKYGIIPDTRKYILQRSKTISGDTPYILFVSNNVEFTMPEGMISKIVFGERDLCKYISTYNIRSLGSRRDLNIRFSPDLWNMPSHEDSFIHETYSIGSYPYSFINVVCRTGYQEITVCVNEHIRTILTQKMIVFPDTKSLTFTDEYGTTFEITRMYGQHLKEVWPYDDNIKIFFKCYDSVDGNNCVIKLRLMK